MNDRTDIAPVIFPRPAWADETQLEASTIDYTWTAPTVAEGIEPDGGEFVPIRVELNQPNDLRVTEKGVILDPGVTRVFLLDTRFDSANARLLAQAIVECCDRLDAAGGDR